MLLPSGILYSIIRKCAIDIRIHFDCIGNIQSKFDDALYKTIPTIRHGSGFVILPLKNNLKISLK